MISIIRTLAESVRRFNEDKCWTAAIVISYFSLLCVVPVLALFFFLSTNLIGGTEIALRSLNLFTDAFFAHLDPEFLKNLAGLHKNIASLGLFGLIGSVISASFLFASVISTLNTIFNVNIKRSFFYNRIIEYLTMFVGGIIMIFSLAITAAWTALSLALAASDIVASYINPGAMDLVNNFFIQYLIPYGLTFLVYFIMYKYIPEVKVHLRAAVFPALIAALFYEIFKRLFAFYVVHFSAVGMVLSKMLQGTLTSIIFFMLWITSSMVIMLWGAEFASVLNERIEARSKKTEISAGPAD